MERFTLLLLTIFLVFTMPASYAGGGHGGGGHGGGHGGHGGGHYGGHSGGHGSVFIGYSGYYPFPYYYPPYYPARVIVTEPVAPTVYIEKSAQAEPNYRYYCTDPKGYYPRVDRCPTGWLQVVPRSPQH